MRRNVIGTVLITLLIVGAMGAIGFGLYQIGFQQGLVENGAEVVVNRVHDGVRGVGWGGWGGWGAGFGFFGLILKVLFFFLIFGLIARFFFGPRRWGPGGYWGGRDWDDGQHPMEKRMTEWHDKAHRDEQSQSDPGT